MAETLIHPLAEVKASPARPPKPAPGLQAVRGRVVRYSQRTGIGFVQSPTRRIAFRVPGTGLHVGDVVEAHVDDRNFAVEVFLLPQ